MRKRSGFTRRRLDSLGHAGHDGGGRDATVQAEVVLPETRTRSARGSLSGGGSGGRGGGVARRQMDSLGHAGYDGGRRGAAAETEIVLPETRTRSLIGNLS